MGLISVSVDCTSMLYTDLNCDMGEGFGTNDEVLIRHISSANIACGFHAGDAATMRRTAALALKHGVAIGAHPGFPDLEGFGRRNMALSPQEVYDICLYQIGALLNIVQSLGGSLHHVKPHGALYNMAAKDAALAASITHAVRDTDPQLILYGLSGSCLISEARKADLRTASEVFADRSYQDDGSLTPRSQPDALIEDTQVAVGQVINMVKHGSVRAVSGKEIAITADTICLHGDGSHAVAFASALAHTLNIEGIVIKAV